MRRCHCPIVAFTVTYIAFLEDRDAVPVVWKVNRPGQDGGGAIEERMHGAFRKLSVDRALAIERR